MGSYVIHGGHKLQGTLTTNTSKNAAVVLLNAALLNKGTTTLKQVPQIQEVYRIIEVLESIGVMVRWSGNQDLIIKPPKRLQLTKLNVASAIRTRSILFWLGVMAHHQQSFSVPHPGGCRLGTRTVKPHLFALEHFGISIKAVAKWYHVRAPKLHAGGEIVLYESGDTVTENAIMVAALTPGRTVLKYASANYQVQDLCFFLQKLGVKISGIGTTTLEIHGIRKPDKNITYHLSEDPIESMLFIAIAVTTKSSLTIKRCPIEFIELELLKLEKMGFHYKVLRRYKAKNGKANLVDIKTYPSTLTALEEKIYARPYPGVNIDNLPFFVPIATQAKGRSMIFDWVYENRAIYYIELNKLGAQIELADPHRVYVQGPTKLTGAEVISPPALRPATIILTAMLAAKGKSVLHSTYSIERGYENLTGRLSQVGAKIEAID